MVSRLVLMGVPNTGSACGNLLTGGLVIAGALSAPAQDLTTLRRSTFNQEVVNRKGVRFSGLVGNSHFQTCGVPGPSDQYVEVSSARWILEDTEIQNMPHIQMTSSPQAFDFIKRRVAMGAQAAQSAATDGVHRPEGAGASSKSRRGLPSCGPQAGADPGIDAEEDPGRRQARRS